MLSKFTSGSLQRSQKFAEVNVVYSERKKCVKLRLVRVYCTVHTVLYNFSISIYFLYDNFFLFFFFLLLLLKRTTRRQEQKAKQQRHEEKKEKIKTT